MEKSSNNSLDLTAFIDLLFKNNNASHSLSTEVVKNRFVLVFSMNTVKKTSRKPCENHKKTGSTGFILKELHILQNDSEKSSFNF